MVIKKAELHVHLEGTISPDLAKKLAHRNQLSLPNDLLNAAGTSYFSRDFMHFLQVYDVVAGLIKTPQDYYDVTFDYLKASARENTIYVEMMYSPDHAEQASGIPSIEHLHAIQEAVNHAEEQFGIVGRIIVTAVRHFGATSAERVAHEIAKKSVPCVTGFGLGGDEANFPPRLFEKAYRIAAEQAGLLCTVHAGEFDSARGMQEAIEHLPIKRIGHGVAAIDSPETMALLKEQNIALEICPSSNIKLGLYKNMAEHPFPKFLDSGLNISLNSDDPPFFGTTLAEEYKRVQEAYQYSNDSMNNITKMAIDSAFVDADTKQKLQKKIDR